MTTDLLKRLGYLTDVSSNGLDAPEALKRQEYDVIFMDVQMPEMDGVMATAHIRQRYPQRAPRIIAMTAPTIPSSLSVEEMESTQESHYSLQGCAEKFSFCTISTPATLKNSSAFSSCR